MYIQKLLMEYKNKKNMVTNPYQYMKVSMLIFLWVLSIFPCSAQKPIMHTPKENNDGLSSTSSTNRTIRDLLYYPFGFINPNRSQSKMIEMVDRQFGSHQIVKTGFMRVPCIVVGRETGYNYKYKNQQIVTAICEHVESTNDVYGYFYLWSFETKTDAVAFAKGMVADIANLGIRLKIVNTDHFYYDASRYNLKQFEHITVCAFNAEEKDFPEMIELPKHCVMLEICDPGRKYW